MTSQDTTEKNSRLVLHQFNFIGFDPREIVTHNTIVADTNLKSSLDPQMIVAGSISGETEAQEQDQLSDMSSVIDIHSWTDADLFHKKINSA